MREGADPSEKIAAELAAVDIATLKRGEMILRMPLKSPSRRMPARTLAHCALSAPRLIVCVQGGRCF